MLPRLLIIVLAGAFVHAQEKPGPPTRARAQVSCETQLGRCQSENGRLKESNATLANQVSELRRVANNSAEQLSALKDSNGKLTNQVSELRQSANSSAQQLRALQNENAQLKAANTDLKSRLSRAESAKTFEQELNAANNQVINLRSDNQRLLGANQDLNNQLTQSLQRITGLEGELTASKAELVALKQGAPTPSETLSQVNPQTVLNLAKEQKLEKAQKGNGATWSYDADGKTHVITELVIGTLKTEYEKEVKPGSDYQLKATFEPHPILNPRRVEGSSAEDVKWYMELSYLSNKIKFVYDPELSGRKEQRREIQVSNQKETWGWKISPPANFEKDKSEIVVYAGYKLASEEKPLEDLDRLSVEISEKEVPGTFTVFWGFIKDNLSYILASIGTILGIWLTYVSIQKSRLEVKLKELELSPQPGGQAA